MGTSCAFTGHRPQRFPWGFHETDPRCAALKAVLCCEIKALHQAGVKAFFSGMALGVDSWAAQAVLALRKEDPAVTLHCVLPCEDQDKRWSPPAQKAYREILVQADSISYATVAVCWRGTGDWWTVPPFCWRSTMEVHLEEQRQQFAMPNSRRRRSYASSLSPWKSQKTDMLILLHFRQALRCLW